MITKNYNPKSSKKSQLSLFPAVLPQQENVSVDVLHQYFFLISPPETIKGKIKSLKQKLHSTIGLSNYNLHSIAHISLLSFHTRKPVNDRFIAAAQQLFFKNNSFPIKLNGIDSFAHGTSSNTLYVKIDDSEQIEKMYKDLNLLLGFPVKAFVPHLTIARTIPRSNFEKGLEIVKPHRFDEEFKCSKITILERKLQNGTVSPYKVFKEIELW